MPPLPFTRPALHDAAAVHHAVESVQAQQSDLSFANMFLLQKKYGTEIAMAEGFLFRHFSGRGRLQGYAFPCGSGDLRPALRSIEEDAAQRGRPLRFCLLTEEQVQQLEQFFPGRFDFHADPGDADYIYERSLLAELPGARFHRKRNHIARFMRECPTWNMALLLPENAADALRVAQGWLASAPSDSPALLHEHEAITHALQSMNELSLLGALLYVDDAPVAMSVASMISEEVADIHYEKCLPEFRAAYPVINQGLASMLNCRLVNREEDLNQENLRQAKLSYFPSLVLSKYTAVLC